MAVTVTSWLVVTSSVSVSARPAGRGEDLQADVAANVGPLVVLLSQHRADEADEGLAVREHADDVGAPADLAVEPFLRVGGPDSAPDRLGERR